MKVNIKNLKVISMLLIIGCLTACTKDFEDINTDPNRLTAVPPGTLLAPAQFDAMEILLTRSHRLNNEIMQYTVDMGALNDFTRYEFRENEFDAIWLTLYRTANDMNQMYMLAEKTNDVNNMAMALVMKAWMVSNLTDMFGDIPYSEAFKALDGLYYPKFDTQQSIYTSLLADLKRANTLFSVTKPFEATDLIYPLLDSKIDVMKWKKFTNSLRIRLLTRVSDRPEMNAPAEIAEIVSNPTIYPIIASNDDEAMMRYTPVKPFLSPFVEMTSTTFSGSRRMGKFLIDLMNTPYVDGRRFRYATKDNNPVATSQAYIGIGSGYSEKETTEMASAGFGASTLATTLKGSNYPFPILTWSEVNFNLAEAALKGWIPGGVTSAQGYYNKGIEASWRQWSCTWDGTAGTNFLARAAVKFSGTTATMERLMTQKYLAMFFCGFESWYDYRRTGYPVLPIGPAVQNDGILPRRFEYPLVVKATNKANYEEAASRIGGDNLKTKVWWQL